MDFLVYGVSDQGYLQVLNDEDESRNICREQERLRKREFFAVDTRLQGSNYGRYDEQHYNGRFDSCYSQIKLIIYPI